MKDIRWAHMALADLDAIDSYHRRLDSRLADRLTGLVVEAGAFLAERPHGGPVDRGTRRRWLVAGTPYLLFYRVESAHVRILRVRHGARSPLR